MFNPPLNPRGVFAWGFVAAMDVCFTLRYGYGWGAVAFGLTAVVVALKG